MPRCAQTLFKRFMASHAGFTLAEVVIAVGILSIITSIMGASFFQAFLVNNDWRDDANATHQWRQAMNLFATDALNAEATDLTDGGPTAGSVNLSWTDLAGVPHTADYSVAGGLLLRTFDGQRFVAARQVVSAQFSLLSGL